MSASQAFVYVHFLQRNIMIELLIGVVVTVLVGRYIIKGYSATGILMAGGLLLIRVLMGKSVLPASAKSTWWGLTDIVEYVKILLMSRDGYLRLAGGIDPVADLWRRGAGGTGFANEAGGFCL